MIKEEIKELSMQNFRWPLPAAMTVQELIDELNKIEDKSKEVFRCNGGDIEKVIERDDNVILC